MKIVCLASRKQFLVIFGRTDFRISLSGAKFDAEADFDVHSAVAPLKISPNRRTTDFRDKKNMEICSFHLSGRHGNLFVSS